MNSKECTTEHGHPVVESEDNKGRFPGTGQREETGPPRRTSGKLTKLNIPAFDRGIGSIHVEIRYKDVPSPTFWLLSLSSSDSWETFSVTCDCPNVPHGEWYLYHQDWPALLNCL